MPFLRDLEATLHLDRRAVRQLRMAGVRNKPDLYAFLTTFPSLVEGRADGTVSTGFARAFVDAAYAQESRRAPEFGRERSRIPPSAPRPWQQLLTIEPASAGDRLLRDLLEFSLTDPETERIAVLAGRSPRGVATGAIPVAGPRAVPGTTVPFELLDRPFRERRSDGGTWKIIIEVDTRPFDVDIEVHAPEHRAGAVGPGVRIEGWEDYVTSIPSLGTPVKVPLPAAWPVRDQGIRSTCTAFAVVACAELQDRADGVLRDYSEEALFSRAGGNDERGALLSEVADAIGSGGLALESDLPYGAASAPVDWSRLSPVPLRFRTSAAAFPTAASIYHHLAEGRAVAASLPVFEGPSGVGSNWSTTRGYASGRVLGAPGGSSRSSLSHAVCFVGYEPGEDGGDFIFRNSWSQEWGADPYSESPWHPGPGYGVVQASLVQGLAEMIAVCSR